MSVRILQGDVFQVLPTVAAESVHCCVTSPPYWALRSYLKADDPLKPLELGSEATPEEHVSRMVDVFRQVRRVLRNDGLCWVNYGDTYSTGTNDPKSNRRDKANCCQTAVDRFTGLQPLDRVGIPERFALAMQADGWLWRDTIIWHKRSPMPSSLSGTAWVRCRVKVSNGSVAKRVVSGRQAVECAVSPSNRHTLASWIDCPGCDKCRDTGGYVLRRGSWRTTPAHEYIFLFAKQAGYYADQEGVKEPCATSTLEREKYSRILDDADEQFSVAHDHESTSGGMRNPRSVMSFKQFNLKEKHYAAFPPALAEFCIKASTSPHGVCSECGAQYARVLEKSAWTMNIRVRDVGKARIKSTDHCATKEEVDAYGVEQGGISRLLGWRPTCSCNVGQPVSATVLDPFGGSGTTGLVADRLGRDAVLIELNPEYVAMGKRRIKKDAGMFAEVE